MGTTYRIAIFIVLSLISLKVLSQEYSTEFTCEVAGDYTLHYEFEGDMGRNNIAELCLSPSQSLSNGLVIQISGEGISLFLNKKNGDREILA
ncbi:MAG: hypothetical protein GQ579_00885, partial [Bacteroidales bacterium]|nr:hypothetical protein [Bacteroidales bacterium]